MDVLSAIKSRRSTRAFLDKPVSPKILTMIMEHARWAPSGVNTQPWQVAVVSGTVKQTITTALLAARNGGVEPNPDYAYYPTEWVEPYKSRRLETGLALYGALNIGREDKEKRLEPGTTTIAFSRPRWDCSFLLMISWPKVLGWIWGCLSRT